MKDIDAYFAFLDSLVRHSIAVENSVLYRYLSRNKGYISGQVAFADGSRLEFYEDISLAKRQVVRVRYRYQYMQGNKTIFRYDTAPHYPQLKTFPYHRHDEKGRVEASSPVSLQQVLDEIASIIESNQE